MSQVEKDVEAVLQNVSVYLQSRLVAGFSYTSYLSHSKQKSNLTYFSITRIVLKIDVYTF